LWPHFSGGVSPTLAEIAPKYDAAMPMEGDQWNTVGVQQFTAGDRSQFSALSSSTGFRAAAR
jgi:hypothetical protein